MGNMKVTPCPLEGLYLIEPAVYRDARGEFLELYNRRDFAAAGLEATFVQDNRSVSRQGVLRGLHYQKRHPQGKLVWVAAGAVFDVAVDLRPGPGYGKWFAAELSGENRRQLYIPPGFAHGFLALSQAEFCYKCTDYYRPEDEGGILWSDPALGIDWPLGGRAPLLSPKDLQWKGLEHI